MRTTLIFLNLELIFPKYTNSVRFSVSFSQMKNLISTATFKYHSTTLFELEYMYCDEMRIILAVPKTEIVKLKEYQNWFYYYDLQELDGIFLQFLTNKLTRFHSRSTVFPFVIFDNKLENKISLTM